MVRLERSERDDTISGQRDCWLAEVGEDGDRRGRGVKKRERIDRDKEMVFQIRQFIERKRWNRDNSLMGCVSW